jgi:hypothetical protein
VILLSPVPFDLPLAFSIRKLLESSLPLTFLHIFQRCYTSHCSSKGPGNESDSADKVDWSALAKTPVFGAEQLRTIVHEAF